MLAVIVRRVAVGIPVVFGVAVTLFVVLRLLPGDPVSVLLQGAPADAKQVSALKHQLGLDRSLPSQFGIFLWHAVQGDFGRSYQTKQSVTAMIGAQAMPTVQLMLTAVIFTAILGTTLGVVAAVYRNTWLDGLIRVISLLGTSMPSFWVGILLLMLFSFRLHVFPATGTGGLDRLILPGIALSLAAGGIVARLVRNSVIEVMGEGFVVALVAKGISRPVIVLKHVLRNALIPAITIVGFQIGALLAGAVIVETVFARQGLGRLLVTAIQGDDYPVVEGTVLLIAVAYVVINILVDISYAYVDPRIRSALTSQ